MKNDIEGTCCLPNFRGARIKNEKTLSCFIVQDEEQEVELETFSSLSSQTILSQSLEYIQLVGFAACVPLWHPYFVENWRK